MNTSICSKRALCASNHFWGRTEGTGVRPTAPAFYSLDKKNHPDVKDCPIRLQKVVHITSLSHSKSQLLLSGFLKNFNFYVRDHLSTRGKCLKLIPIASSDSICTAVRELSFHRQGLLQRETAAMPQTQVVAFRSRCSFRVGICTYTVGSIQARLTLQTRSWKSVSLHTLTRTISQSTAF